ncbi:MAG: NrpR regulatory domain-containing protein [Candidatus Subteraquimicrobiales bacterium]|nr:NrpR regulatory domain-containing protein [Candidatus Subteraquimicrobiales bacterium]
MEKDIERKIINILKILSKETEPLGASIISRRLEKLGIDLSERAVRYHLKIMDERGLTEGFGKEGRLITKKGLEELDNALVSDKVGFISAKIDTLSYLTSLNLDDKKGNIILNVSLLNKGDFKKAIEVMRDVFKARLCMSDLVAVAFEGERLGEIEVPAGKIGFGTVCSVTLNGVLVKAGIPVDSRFGAILQMENFKPLRFTELITYEGSSLDPLEVFIKSRMSSVRETALTGSGKILAGFREVSAAALGRVNEIVEKLEQVGIYGVLKVGRPSQPVLEMLVGTDRVGIVVAGGLNPLAALEEVGVETESKAMSTIVDFKKLKSFWEL